jgi:bla regulator protein BlaR1
MRRVMNKHSTYGLICVAMSFAVQPHVIAQQHSSTSGEAATPRASYDIATIKPNKTLSNSIDINTNDATFVAHNASMKMLLQMAYNIRQDLIFGLSNPAESAHYDISAKVLDVDPEILKNLSREERRQMLVRLLQDRFKVQTHIEIKTLPVFDMVVLKDGIKFKPFTPTSSDDPGGDMNTHGSNNNVSMIGRGVPMSDWADAIGDQIGRTVIDKTELHGKYDLDLKWLRDDAPQGTDDAAPTIYTALQEQMGLKLVASKGPVKTLVVDHIEMPSEN